MTGFACMLVYSRSVMYSIVWQQRKVKNTSQAMPNCRMKRRIDDDRHICAVHVGYLLNNKHTHIHTVTVRVEEGLNDCLCPSCWSKANRSD